MNWQEFEHRMNEGLQGHQSPVDTDALWQGIQGQQRRRRRPFLFWWWGCTGGTVLAFFGLLAYLWLSPNQNTAQSDSTVAYPSINNNANNSTPDAAFNNNTSNNAPITTSTNTPTANNYLGTSSNTTPESIAARQPINTTTTTKTNKNNRNNGKTYPSIAAEHSRAQIDATRSVPSNPPAAIPLADIQSPAPQNVALEEPVAPNTVPTTPFATHIAQAATPVDSAVTKAMPSVQEPVTVDSTEKKTLPGIPEKPAADSALSIDIKQPKQRFSIGLQAQLGIWRRFETAESPNDTGAPVPQYNHHRNERVLEAQAYRLVMSVPLAQRCFLTTGIGYSRHTSVLRWQQSWVNDATAVQVPSLYTNGTEDSVEIMVRTLSKRTVRHYNSVTNWQIPVEFRYDFGKKIQLSPYLGFTANLRQRATGRVLNADGQPDTGTYLPMAYRRQLGWSGQLGLDASLMLGKRARLGLGTYFALDATDRLQSAGIERFGQWGIRMGISMGL